MKIIPSERLQYALMGPDDAEELYVLDQDPEVMRYINGGHMTTRQEVQDIFLPRMAQYTRHDKGWGLWKLTTTADQQFIGWVLVRPMDFFNEQPHWHNWELGWRLMRQAWGFGYATEAARHILQQLSETQDVQVWSAIAMPDNMASINIMKKLGMIYLKTDIYSDPLGDEEVVFYLEVLKLHRNRQLK